MTRTTLKALWFGGGGILATWLAVSPNHGLPSSNPTYSTQAPAAAPETSAEHLNAQTDRLRERAGATALRESTRNPFRYNSHRPAARVVRDVQPVITDVPVVPTPAPTLLSLSGVAQKSGKRTAIITNQGQLYVVGEGEKFAGRYTVVKIDSETVLISDTEGAQQRLVLPQ